MIHQNCTRADTRRSAVAVIADCTAYDLLYSYRMLCGIALISMSICLFTASNCSLLLLPDVCGWCLLGFSQLLCFVAKRYILQQKCLKKWMNRKCLPRNTAVQLSTPTLTLSATVHSIADRQTDDSMMPVADQIAWLPVRQHIDYKLAVLTYTIRHTSTPAYLSHHIRPRESTFYMPPPFFIHTSATQTDYQNLLCRPRFPMLCSYRLELSEQWYFVL